MKRINTPDGKFHEAVPGKDIPATRITDEWLNSVQEEILSVLDAVDMVPDANDNTQLSKAISKYFSETEAPVKVDLVNGQVVPRRMNVNLDKIGLKFCLIHGVSERLSREMVINEPFELICTKSLISDRLKWNAFFKPFGLKENYSIEVSITDDGELQYTSTSLQEPHQGRIYLSFTKRERT